MTGGATIALKSLYVEGNGGIAAVSFISVAQSIPDTTFTAIAWPVPLFNGGGMFNAGTPTRLTAPHPGTWVFNFHLQFDSSAAGNRALQIRANGTTYLVPVDLNPGSASASTYLNLTLPVTLLNGGDYLEAMVSQTSGAPLNLLAARVEIQQP